MRLMLNLLMSQIRLNKQRPTSDTTAVDTLPVARQPSAMTASQFCRSKIRRMIHNFMKAWCGELIGQKRETWTIPFVFANSLTKSNHASFACLGLRVGNWRCSYLFLEKTCHLCIGPSIKQWMAICNNTSGQSGGREIRILKMWISLTFVGKWHHSHHVGWSWQRPQGWCKVKTKKNPENVAP